MKIDNKKPMMKCGHAANAIQNEKPVCVICCGIAEGWDEIVKTPDLSNRKAKCGCGKIVESNTDLPFFEYLSDKEYDSYYCGHSGWE